MPALTIRTKQLVERIRGVDPHAVDALLALGFTAAALWTVAERVGSGRCVPRRRLPRDRTAASPDLADRRAQGRAAGSLDASALPPSRCTSLLDIEGVPAGTFAALVILYSAASLTDTRQGILAALDRRRRHHHLLHHGPRRPRPTQAVTTYATYAAAWGLGVYVRSRREYTNVVEERASLLEREREVQAREAVADERARIARELHDMVGHALNLIVIQSGGAQRVFESRPELVRGLARLDRVDRAGRR